MPYNATNTSELRKNLGEALDWVVESKMPLCVQKRVAGGTRDTVILPLEVFEQCMEALSLSVETLNEPDGSTTLLCKELSVYANAPDRAQASEVMLSSLRDYARDYTANIRLYQSAPNTREQLVYVLKILQSDDAHLMRALGLTRSDER